MHAFYPETLESWDTPSVYLVWMEEESCCEEKESGPDVDKFLDDTLSSCKIQSPVPHVALEQECCMGIDEAGRGPVLGQWKCIIIVSWRDYKGICVQVLWCTALPSVPSLCWSK